MYNYCIESFRKLIDKRISDLERYSSNDNAKAIYIRIENELIQELVSIYNVVSVLKYYDIWVIIEERIIRLEKMDSQIHGHIIEFRMKEKGNNFTFITINPSE